jgi:dTDP-glucose pyrophosphorylase
MKDLTIRLDVSIRDSMKKMSKAGEKCLVVVDEKKTLLGTLSDGDIRKAILSGVKIKTSIQDIFNTSPTFLVLGEYKIDEVEQLFYQKRLDVIPVVNNSNQLIDILIWEKILKLNNKSKRRLNVPVVIMAGGKGTRMEPFTKVLPKPLIPIHDKTIIEHIIDSFLNLGCQNFHLTVNYKNKVIKAYFEELNPVYNVLFYNETEPLGTAGSLGYLKGSFKEPFFVTNCDIIVKTDYRSVYEFHQKHNYDITLVASFKEYIIPYGTCELNEEGHLSHINEKPKYDFLINTGLYILSPSILELIKKNQFYHITHLIEDAKNQGKKIGVFPIDEEDWIDIGQWAEYKKAINKF